MDCFLFEMVCHASSMHSCMLPRDEYSTEDRRGETPRKGCQEGQSIRQSGEPGLEPWTVMRTDSCVFLFDN